MKSPKIPRDPVNVLYEDSAIDSVERVGCWECWKEIYYKKNHGIYMLAIPGRMELCRSEPKALGRSDQQAEGSCLGTVLRKLPAKKELLQEKQKEIATCVMVGVPV